MRVRIAVIAILALSALQAQTQVLQPRVWPQEPDSFLGIRFGQPLRASVVECPHVTENGYTSYDWPNFGRPCFTPSEGSPGAYDVYNLGTFYDIYVYEVNGKVECITTKFKAWRADAVAQALTEKFGAAHLDKIVTVQNKMGASFDDRTLTWKGTNVEIDFDSIGSKVDEGGVAAYTAAYVESTTRDQKQQKDAVKGVL
ncbi:MAG: hypothetical protein WBM14_06905 [Terracidiphilus sp.]